jgi:hypothetical protein
VDLGYKYTKGKRTAELAVRVHVREKLDRAHLGPAALVPEDLDGVATDVLQAKYKPHAEVHAPPERTRPAPRIQPGISVGHHRLHQAGTLGAVVYCRRTGQPCLLSAWHVLAVTTQAQTGDAITQPGPSDGGDASRDVVGRLLRWSREVDAAIASYNGARLLLTAQLAADPADGVVLQAARMPRLGEVLVKSGRTTGVTRARVDAEGRYNIPYLDGARWMRGFMLVPEAAGNPADEEISAFGDSGAVVYDPAGREGVGLLIAGETDASPTKEQAIAVPLPDVLESLDVSLTAPFLPAAATEARAGSGALGPGPEARVRSALAEWVGANRERLEPLRSLLRSVAADGATAGDIVYESYDGGVEVALRTQAETKAAHVRLGI